jgi:hypothetical protein
MARQQPGCRTLIMEIYGVGEPTAITILAELGDTAGSRSTVIMSSSPPAPAATARASHSPENS